LSTLIFLNKPYTKCRKSLPNDYINKAYNEKPNASLIYCVWNFKFAQTAKIFNIKCTNRFKNVHAYYHRLLTFVVVFLNTRLLKFWKCFRLRLRHLCLPLQATQPECLPTLAVMPCHINHLYICIFYWADMLMRGRQ